MLRKEIAIKQILVLLMGVVLVSFFAYQHLKGQNKLKGYFTIGVIINSHELTESDLEVLQNIISKKLTEINQTGGVNGRELRVKYLDDQGSPEVAKKIVQETINDQHIIGYVGCWSSTRTKAIAEIVGPARVPYIGGYALTPLFQKYPTMYTAEKGINDVTDRFELFLKDKYKRLGFIGRAGDLYSMSLLQKFYDLQKNDSSVKVIMEKWYPENHKVSPAEIDTLITTLKANNADLLLISFASGLTSTLIKEIRAAKVDVTVFTALGDLGHVIAQSEKKALGEIYDLNVVGIPGTFNLRLQEQIPAFNTEIKPGQTLEFQLSFSARFADSIGLLADALKISDAPESINIRERINNGLQKYVGGGRIYRGWFDDWYFTSDRAIAGDVLLAWKPTLLNRQILAPEQYMRVNDSLRKVPVFFTHLDMVQINRISDVDGSFYATFYLEITSPSKIDISRIDFTNAARSETSHEYLLDIKPISFKTIPGKKVLYNHMYRISGKFLFEPDLKNYPFDNQKFTIQLQPSNALHPFFIQPSIIALNDSVFEVSGWHYQNQYVGYDHDIISYVNSFDDKQRTLPYYKFNYTYVLVRARADFFLKVLTPLLVILIVTYFSVFIPLHRFETLEAIQVTSLLASIALYFSAYKPEMEYATISDKIFIFTYIMITSLIGTSILQFVHHNKHDTESTLARIYQRYVFPIIIAVFTITIVS
jgi:ABC-type branched-subunit amino acid transport system substrate-binding protein